MPTRGNTMISINGKNFGNGEIGSIFTGEIIYSANLHKHTKQLKAKDCQVEVPQTKLTCVTVPGFGKDLSFKAVVGDTQSSQCTDVNVLNTVELKRVKCGGNCIMWCDQCVDQQFFRSSSISNCKTDTSEMIRSDWDPKHGGGTTTPEYRSRGCWKTNYRPIDNAHKITVQVLEEDLLTLTDVKNTCARIARRNAWLYFGLRGCIRGNDVMTCECTAATAVPKVSSYFAFGADIHCTDSDTGGTEQSGAISIYVLGKLSNKRTASVWTASSIGYASPIITDILGANNSQTTGGNEITIRGTDFGPSDSGFVAFARYGNPNASSIPRPLPFDAINCRVPLENDFNNIICIMAPGVGSGHSWRVTLGGNGETDGRRRRLSFSWRAPFVRRYLEANGAVTSEEFKAYTRYRSPVIESFSNPFVLKKDEGGEDPTKKYITSGSEIVEIRGSNLGPESNVTYYAFNINAVAIWPTNLISDKSLTTFQALNCNTYIPHKSIRCVVPEGAGANIAWKLFVDGQQSVQPTTAYGPPEIYKIWPETNRGTGAVSNGNSTSDASSIGGDIIHIQGKNFGGSIKYLESMTYGCGGSSSAWSFDITKSCTLTKKHTEFVCTTAPGTGSGLVFTVIVAGQTSLISSASASSASSSSSSSSSFSGPNKIPTLSYQPPIITSIERNNAGGLLTGGVTFGGYMYRLVGTNFGIEVKTRNQLILEHQSIIYHHDLGFPTTAGGGTSSGRRDGVFGAANLDIERNGRKCANPISEITAEKINGGVLAMSECIKQCRLLASPPNYCRQTEYSAIEKSCKFFSFSTKEIGTLSPSSSCTTFMDMLTFNVPEGVGFGLKSKVIHVPAGEIDRCIRNSNEIDFDYKPPFISNMKADLIKVPNTINTRVLLTLRGTGVDDNGARLNPSPTYPYDLGGSYGECTDQNFETSDCFINSKVILYKYDSNLNWPQDQDTTTASPCIITSWQHNMVECNRLFQGGADPRGNLVLYTGWNKPSWWYQKVGEENWYKYVCWICVFAFVVYLLLCY